MQRIRIEKPQKQRTARRTLRRDPAEGVLALDPRDPDIVRVKGARGLSTRRDAFAFRQEGRTPR